MVTRVLQGVFFGVLGVYGGTYAIGSMVEVNNRLEPLAAAVPTFAGLPTVLLAQAIMPVAFLLYLALMGFLALSYILAWDDDE